MLFFINGHIGLMVCGAFLSGTFKYINMGIYLIIIIPQSYILRLRSVLLHSYYNSYSFVKNQIDESGSEVVNGKEYDF